MAKEQGFFAEEGLDVEIGVKYAQVPRGVAEEAYDELVKGRVRFD